ncbi:biotin-dependent carboxyltransferase family protein [Nitratireductor basaltis]|uniref:Urea amidolyase-like protein n=1 Tax=Nitratireductor basaltis TaxID=472175 RepID=A0A084U5V5_9HYPH|nr:biotin-dependent carboxyltransferase family protein [Nitratireductor basaltis]KFB08341.1 Urea amidolyase-like protein [Nitratireductor basaltis]
MIEILSIPPLATVQDLGRVGHWRQGLGRAGAMDPLALRMANLLLGNDEGAAGLEIPLSPARFVFTQDTAFSLVGAACGATLDGIALPRCWAGSAKTGQELSLGAMRDGARVYLGLPGGIDVPEILGSRSTQLREGFGGHEGRVLAPGDRLKGTASCPRVMPISYALPTPREGDATDIVLRVLPSSETKEFSPASRAAFYGQPYKVTPASNRQGYRLEGPELDRDAKGELRSHGIAPGIVQVPGGGQPIIQLADSATMGGYPKIACVIEPDLWRIGQARPGDTLRFQPVDLAQAREAEFAETAMLDAMRQSIAQVRRLQNTWN